MYRKLKHENRRYEIRNQPAGFTLTEVVVASALLIIAIVPILKALTSAHVVGTIIEHKTHSLTLAWAKLDDIRARSIYNYTSTFAETSTSLGGSYLCTVTDSGPSTDLRTVSVSVGYDSNTDNNLDSSETDVTFTTLLAKRW